MPRSDAVRKAIALGRDKGFVTFGELDELFLNELFPSTTAAPEDIEAVMAALSDAGIDVIEDERP
jgi:Sigma-70 factor, region 1.1